MIDFNEDELSNHANLVNDPTLCQNEGCTGSKWLVRAPDGTDVEVPFVFDPQVIDGIAVGRGKPCAQLIIDQESKTPSLSSTSNATRRSGFYARWIFEGFEQK